MCKGRYTSDSSPFLGNIYLILSGGEFYDEYNAKDHCCNSVL